MPARSRLKPYLDEPPVSEEFPDLSAELEAIFADAYDSAIAEAGLEDLISSADAAQIAAAAYADERAAALVTAIDETTRERLQQLIEDAIEKELSAAELADNIGASFAFSDERADLIARSEITDAENIGLGTALQDAGEEYVFVNEPGPAEDEECADIKADGGQIWPIDEFIADPSGHPNCFPSGVLVTAPDRELGYARPFEGELIVLRTASDQFLPVTPNHPILTDRGWRAAKFLRQGDYVIRSTDHAALWAASGTDEYQRPAPIEEVARTPKMDGVSGGTLRAPTRPDDFHGDGKGSKVYVERTLGLLGDRWQTAPREKSAETRLRWRLMAPVSLLYLRSKGKILWRALHPAYRVMCGLRSGVALTRRHLHPFDTARLGMRTLNPEAAKPQPGSRPVNVVPSGDLFLRQFFRKVEAAQRRIRRAAAERVARPMDSRLDRASFRMAVPGIRSTSAEALPNLLDSLAGLVAAEKIVSVGTCWYRGHVFNLQTAGHWYIAGEYISRNCEREGRPLTPEEVDEMAAEEAAGAEGDLP